MSEQVYFSKCSHCVSLAQLFKRKWASSGEESFIHHADIPDGRVPVS